MNEWLTWQMTQLCLSCAVFGISIGLGVYHTQHPSHTSYSVSTYRDTTYTGKGQFRCQTGCPQLAWNQR